MSGYATYVASRLNNSPGKHSEALLLTPGTEHKQTQMGAYGTRSQLPAWGRSVHASDATTRRLERAKPWRPAWCPTRLPRLSKRSTACLSRSMKRVTDQIQVYCIIGVYYIKHRQIWNDHSLRLGRRRPEMHHMPQLITPPPTSSPVMREVRYSSGEALPPV